MGLGPPGFSENNVLLDEVGFGGVKMWFTLDSAWMFHRRVGAGLWMGMNRRASDRGCNQGGQFTFIGVSCSPSHLNEVAYFIGAQLPILLWGERAYSFHLTPRGGFLAGQLELDDDEDAPFQNTGIVGGAVSFQSFTYHIGSSISFMHAPSSAPGELGRGHDYGGLYFTLSTSLDG
jgi:hypothetical protein